MVFNSIQKDIVKRLQLSIEHGEFRNGMSVGFIKEICEAFDGNPLWSLHGVGGTRMVITHPEREGFVLKIAFNENGVEGSTDEYNDYHAAPDDVKEFLAKPGELFEDGLILEMAYYEAFTEEQQLDDYQQELNKILNRIRFIHYQDPPYHHSFGVNDQGVLALLDYGETEKFELITENKNDKDPV